MNPQYDSAIKSDKFNTFLIKTTDKGIQVSFIKDNLHVIHYFDTFEDAMKYVNQEQNRNTIKDD